MKYSLLALLILLVGYPVGCGPHMVASRHVGEAITHNAKLAVLPFENLSGRENAAEKITDYVVLGLQSVNKISVAEFGQTYEQMRRYRVRSSAFLTDAQIDSLSVGLGAAYLITGAVLEFTEIDNQYLGKVPQVSINVRVIKCATKQTVWSGSVNARGDQGEIVFGIGAVRSKDELAHEVVSKVVEQISSLVGK